MELTWEDPPVRVRGSWTALLDALRERPGEWAKFGPYADAAQVAKDLRRGRRGNAMPGEFEIESHRIEHEGFVYLRCLADPMVLRVVR